MSIESGELKLGASNAEQPVILGDTFLTSLNGVLEGLKGVMDALSGEPSLKVTPALSQTLSQTIIKYQEKIEDFTSKTVKSI